MTRDEIEKAYWEHDQELIDFAIRIHDAALDEAALIPGMCMTGCYGTVPCAHCAQKAEYIRALKIGTKGEL